MNVSKGRFFENKASGFLIKAGHNLLARNFYTPFGEIDIISEFRNKIYFTEVKFVTTKNKLHPIQKIDQSKIRKIYLSISYLKKFCKIRNLQVDSLCIYYKKTYPTSAAELVFEHYQDLRLG
jgi:putative endonuclease